MGRSARRRGVPVVAALAVTGATGLKHTTVFHRKMESTVTAKINEALEAHETFGESANFGQALHSTAEVVKKHARHRKGSTSGVADGPTAVLMKELLGFGEDFTCEDPDSTYDATKFQVGGISARGTEWRFDISGMNADVFEYSGMDAQLKCRDGSWPVFPQTVETDKGPKGWEEACEMGVNQCGGAYDTGCYGEKTEKSAAINGFLKEVFIPKFNKCCESHDRGYCYPAGGPDVESNWTSDAYPFAKGQRPYDEETTPYIWSNMLGNNQHPPFNPSGGKLAVDDRFQVCMERICADDPEFGDNASGPIQQVYDSVWNAVPDWIRNFAPDALKDKAKKLIRDKLAPKKNLARGWCDLRAQIAAAAVRAGGLKAYTAKQAAMLSCPPPPACPDGCLEGAGGEVNSAAAP